MTYSCTDFTDSILDALKLDRAMVDHDKKHPEDDVFDNPSIQADLALAEIDRLQKQNALLLNFARAIGEAFPFNAPRDRFGRFIGPQNTDPLRVLAVHHKTRPAQDVMEQAGEVARAIIK
jgi:hypothetical protein